MMMMPRVPARRRIIASTGAALIAVVFVAWYIGPARREPETPESATAPSPAVLTKREAPPLPVSKSPFLNAGPEARYVGSQICEQCHSDAKKSYLETAMAHSMAEVDLVQEPPDGEFNHLTSGRRYTIYREGDALRQREVLTGVSGVGDVLLADHPLRYVVGSGHFARTYLAENNGFLVEAPATWFAVRNGWDMSPGYDRPLPESFERAITENCLFCHAGRIEMIDRSLHKVKIHELAIGCERCHGPGSLHVEQRSRSISVSDDADGQAIDYTIVNPAHLPRELAEAVCQQCHLTSAAQVAARGRKLSDFRPGLPLQDFFPSYCLSDPTSSMKVVGHIEQLARSKCYQSSETLTCLTCHNPHQKPKAEERVDYFRKICLSCHNADDCRGDHGSNSSQAAANDCVKCHMPAVPTEIVHLAFTHHRIGIHSPTHESVDEPDTATLELEPFHNLSQWSELDFQRSLGLAWFDRGLDPGPHTGFALDRAEGILQQVFDQGLQEGSVVAALAYAKSRRADPATPVLAAEALQDPEVPAVHRIHALSLLAQDHYQNKRFDEAIKVLTELTTLRRSAADRALLGFCHLARQDAPAAMSSFEESVAINPGMLPLHRLLAQLYQAAGNHDKARRQAQIGARLLSIRKAASPPPRSGTKSKPDTNITVPQDSNP